MRLATLAGRAVLLTGTGAVDIAAASGQRFGPDPMAPFDDWTAFSAWARAAELPAAEPYDPDELGAPVPRPRQVFAVALNYRPHAAEAGFEPPGDPLVFTKFPSCLTGPYATVELPGDRVDWEIELVAAIGTGGRHIAEDAAWGHVAGLTAGQDLSERGVQSRGAPPQFSLGKSFPGFGPTGPALVTLDEFADPSDLELTALLNGAQVQHARTKEMIFTVPDLIARISAICPLLPGDLLFTGTPEGVGNRRTPPRYLTARDTLTSQVAGIGELRTRFR